MGQDTEGRKKKRRKRKLFWLLFDLAIAFFVVALLAYRPGRYVPLEVVRGREESPYLTNKLVPGLHNGKELREPFDLRITQDGINQIIAYSDWPKESGGASFSAPAVLFVPDRIVLMGTATMQGLELVVTIELAAEFDEQGLLSLRFTKVKVGAMNITPLARVVAKKMYQQRVETAPVDKGDWRAQIAASLLNDEPFAPAFEFEGEKLRIEAVTIDKQELTVRLAPVVK
ncbi:MAG: hypothetical protein ACYTBJ_06925 [Planctomycetota bacterium]|jgi:hypothetical protein